MPLSFRTFSFKAPFNVLYHICNDDAQYQFFQEQMVQQYAEDSHLSSLQIYQYDKRL